MEIEKSFIIRCPACRWAEMSTGISDDLAHLHEIKVCANCSGGRKFRCPKCGTPAKMIRVKGNK